MAKGASWEREFSKLLSLWWSDGTNDDWFWRSAMSGGRATVRARKGQKTANAAGDICAQTPEAQRLLNVATFEIKRGYAAYTVSDMLDKQSSRGFAEFVQQSADSASLAGTPLWALVHKRDRREPLIYINEWIPHDCDSRIQVRVGQLWLLGTRLFDFFDDPTIKQYFRTEAAGF